MNDQEAHQGLEAEEQRLAAMRDDLRAQTEESQRQDAEDGSDGGNEQYQREVDLSILEQVESELGDVENALKKLEQGTYGTCEVCHKQIEDERLAAQPATRFCAEHAQQAANQG